MEEFMDKSKEREAGKNTKLSAIAFQILAVGIITSVLFLVIAYGFFMSWLQRLIWSRCSLQSHFVAET